MGFLDLLILGGRTGGVSGCDSKSKKPTAEKPSKPSPASQPASSPVAAAGNISEAIRKEGSIPTGYNGAEGKVEFSKGKINVTTVTEGKDTGFFVEIRPIEVKGTKALSLQVKGRIVQKEGWDHYASIQVIDGNGKRHILQELCKEGKYGSCKGKNVTDPLTIERGTTLTLKLPEDLKSIARFEVVFVGQTRVEAGFSISDIKLAK